jgi:hypothetical protein
MSSSHHDSDPQQLPVPYRPRDVADIVHHKSEWTSGTRGGGKVPADFGWRSNPKQMQEENGSSVMATPISK